RRGSRVRAPSTPPDRPKGERCVRLFLCVFRFRDTIRLSTLYLVIRMFEAVRNNKRIAQVILVLISVTFGFFGIESYLNDRGTVGEVATVGGSPISAYEFEQAIREQQDRIRAANEGQVD